MYLLQKAETWVAISFVVLVIVGFKPIMRMLGEMLDARAAKIRADLDEAARLKTEAQALLDDFKKKQAEAVQTADAIVAHAREEAARIAEESAKALQESLKRRESQAMQRIAQAEQRAMADIRAAAVEVAVSATRRLIEDRLDPARADMLVDGAIRELQNKVA
jgi:F-type H+-transporting ATPase subunit b